MPMSISSMTGFARVEGAHGGHSWVWEVRSVNGRGLDIRVRLPSTLDGMEQEVRKRLGERFKRGSLQVGLQMSRETGASRLRINPEALDQVLDALEDVQGRLSNRTLDIAPARMDGLLSLRGILEVGEGEESAEDKAAREDAILKDLATMIDRLDEARRSEGASLDTVLRDQVSQVETLVAEAAQCAARQPEHLKARLKSQVSALMDASGGTLNEERLTQEAALLATKADIREELDRLTAHVGAARELLAAGTPVGRKLEFLVQEFNREANTLCSKSTDVALTRIGLDLKAVIDQAREQVQNVE